MRFSKIGFIGQGFIGGNLANNFELRGYKDMIVRYDRSPKYAENKELIKKCQLVFVAVPTPSTPDGFDDSVLFDVLPVTGRGSVVVIKSTVPPHVVRKLQETFMDRVVMLCPEFLSEDTARMDTDAPERNLIGVSNMGDPSLVEIAETVIKYLPIAPYNKVGTYEEASLAKYGGNCFFVVKNMFFNMLYDLSQAYGADWERLHDMIVHDTRINPVHTNPMHKKGRGAGGHCLIKDFAAFDDMVKEYLPKDKNAQAITKSNVKKNIELLRNSGKDLDLLNGVYGQKGETLISLWEKIKDYGRPSLQ